MIRTIAVVAVLALAVPAGAQDQTGTIALQDQPATGTQDFRSFQPTTGTIGQEGGQAVYDAVCAGCHMPDGEGAVGAGAYPALADNQNLEFPSYAVLVVVQGQGAMPPLGGILTDEQVVDVVDYIRSSFGNDYVESVGEATVEEAAAVRPVQEDAQ